MNSLWVKNGRGIFLASTAFIAGFSVPGLAQEAVLEAIDPVPQDFPQPEPQPNLASQDSSRIASPLANSSTPGWKSMLTTESVTPEVERQQQAVKAAAFVQRAYQGPVQDMEAAGAGAKTSAMMGLSTVQSPLSIADLARSLKNDADLIYQFVHDNIAFVPIYGVQKGALGALIDGAGTAFDQADLMVQLLRAAGYTANYMKGEVYLTPAQFQAWYGVDVSSACGAWKVPAAGRIPVYDYWSSGVCSTPLAAMRLTHVWVKVNISGTWYMFDPSFKSHTTVPGLSPTTMASALGYNQTTFLNNARSGATITADYAQNINRTNIRSNLATYATNLAAYLRANKPDARLEDVVGGRKIDPVVGTLRQTSLPYQWSGGTPVEWTAIPDTYRITLRVQYQGIDQTFYSDQLAGRRLSITYTAANVPELRLDGVLIASGTAPAVNSWTNATFSTNHQAYADAGANQAIQSGLYAAPDRSYVIANAWGPTGKGSIELHRRRIIAAKAAGHADASEPVRGEILALVAANWTAQLTRATDIQSQFENSVPIWHQQVGIAGQSGSPYVDFGGVLWNNPLRVHDAANEAARSQASGILQAGHLSIFESQTIQEITSVSAVSTMKLLDQAVSLGHKIYDASSTNYTTNVRPNLKSYVAGDLSFIDSQISNSWRVIVPEYGNLVENQYTGVGFHAEKAAGGAFYFYEYINGGLSGGFGSSTAAPGAPNVLENTAPPPVPDYQANAGPIDAFRGNYQYNNTDLALGDTGAPGGLAFVRQYSSGRGAKDGVLGLGWTHNYAGAASAGTDSFQGLGDDSGIDAAAAVAEIFVTNDILVNPAVATIPLDRQVIAKVAHKWFGDVLLNNVVSVTTGSSGQLFVKLPDGSYNGSQGNASKLSLSSGQYVLEMGDGTKANFSTTGDISTLVEPTGLTTTFTYSSGKLTSVGNNAGRALTLGYTGSRITAITDGTGRSVGYSYDSAGNLIQFRNPLNNAWNFGYDQPGRLTQLFLPTAPGSAWLTNSYDADSRLKTQANAAGQVWNFYASGTRFEALDPLNNGTVMYLDAFGNMTSQRDARGFVTQYEHDGHNRLTRTILPELNEVRHSYDSRHNLTQTRRIAKPGSGLADIVTSATFPASCGSDFKTCNQPSATLDAKGYQTDYTYNATTGLVATVTAPPPVTGGVRPQVRYSYGATGGVTLLTGTSTCRTTASCAGGADEVKTTLVNNANLLPTSITVAAGNNALSATTAFTYDTVGNRLTVDGPISGSADTTRTRYDTARQVIGIVAPDPDGGGVALHKAQRQVWNADGRLTLVETGTVTAQTDTAWTAFSSLEQRVLSYDSVGRPIKQETKSGTTTHTLTQMNYDAASRPNCTALRMDPAQWASQTDACVAQTTGPNGPDRISKKIYDAASNVTQVQLGVGTTTPTNEVTSTYSNNGKLASVKDGENNLTTYTYDGFDRLDKTRFPVGTAGANTSSSTDYTQLIYDANSNVIQRRLRYGPLVSYTLDNLNRVITKTLPGNALPTSYTYDNLGRPLTAARTGDGTSHSFTYDALGRTTSESQPYGTMSWQYDLAGRRTRTTWGDGFYAAYEYDSAGQLKVVRENGATSGVGVLATYTYDNLGRRTSLTRGNGATTSTSYDAISRLSSLVHNLSGTAADITIGSMSYNPASQITTQTRSNDAYAWTGHYNVNRNYSVSGRNETIQAGATALGYDARGNLSASGSSNYSYTDENLLVIAPGIILSYDALGRLKGYGPTSDTTRFVHDGAEMATETSATGTILRRYVRADGDDEPLVWYEGAGTTDRRWYHSDERGSIVALSDNTGAMTAINKYDEYGIPGAGNIGRFQYTGQVWIAELGLYYYKARMYSPTLGKFMQTDPVEYEDGMNWYNYVDSDPINTVDPTGEGGVGTETQAQNILVVARRPNNSPRNEISGSRVGTNYKGACPECLLFALIPVGKIVKAALKIYEWISTSPRTDWTLGTGKSAQKWQNQMTKRGWTMHQIDDAIQNGRQFPSRNNINPSHGATRYVSPQTGQSVVIDNATGQVIHVGGPGFVY